MVHGTVPPERRAALEGHLDQCPACLGAFAAAARSTSSHADHAVATRASFGPDRYELDEEIGRGGMGRILAARDRLLDRRVALKLVRAGGGSLARRFAREQRITARLQHPAIVPIYDAGTLANGEPFFAMRMVAGRRLDEAAADARTLEDRLRLLPAVIGVVDAVAYAHGEGVIHRDLKPQNVLVGAFGEVVLVDWGLARATWTDDAGDEDVIAASPATPADVTREGEILGTLGYMAPEQLAGQEVDERADVYGLGAILYHVLAGEPPHAGRSASLSSGAVAHTPAPLATALTEAPADLIAIVERAMARDRTARYASARELAEDLKRWQAGRMVEAHHYRTRELIARFVRRHRAPLAVALAAFALLVVVGALGLSRVLSERTRAEEASRRAEAARDRAETQRAGAEALIDFMLGDLRQRLDRVGRLDTLQGVAQAVLAYQARTPEADGTEARTTVALLAGDVAIASGDLSAAEAAYDRAATAAAAMPPGTAADLGLCRAEIGRGRTQRARGALDASIAAFTACVTRAGEPPREAMRDVSLEARIGVALVVRQRGDLPAARGVLDAALSLAGTGSPPSAAVFQLRVERWRTLDQAGEVALANAEAHAALAVAEARQAAHPDDANLRHDRATARLQLGISEEALGSLPRAEEAYRAAFEEARALSTHDPANAVWLRDVGVAADRLGNLMMRRHQPAAALTWLRESDDQSRRLVALQPSNLDWQRDLGVSALALGDVLVALHRLDDARREVTRALEIFEGIRAVQPGRATQDVGAALGHLADLEAQAGRMPAARAALGRSIAILRETLAASDTPEARHELAAALALLAGAEDSSTRSLALLTEAREILAPLRSRAADPDLAETFALLDREYARFGGK